MNPSSQTGQNWTTEKALTLVWQPAFLSALRESGVIRVACEAANICRSNAYLARANQPDFARAWDDALDDAADLLEQEAIRRARLGIREPVIYQGRPCGVWVNDGGEVVAEGTPGAKLIPLGITKYSDALLMFLLKGIRPDKYRERPPDLPPLEVLLAALPADVREVVRRAMADAVQPRGDPGGRLDPGGNGPLGGVPHRPAAPHA